MSAAVWQRSPVAASRFSSMGLQLLPLRSAAVLFFWSSSATWQRSAVASSRFSSMGLQLLPLRSAAVLFCWTSGTFSWQRSTAASSRFGPVGLQLSSLCPCTERLCWQGSSLTYVGGCSPCSCLFEPPFSLACFCLAARKTHAVAWRDGWRTCARSTLFHACTGPAFSAANSWLTTAMARCHGRDGCKSGLQYCFCRFPVRFVRVRLLSMPSFLWLVLLGQRECRQSAATALGRVQVYGWEACCATRDKQLGPPASWMRFSSRRPDNQ